MPDVFTSSSRSSTYRGNPESERGFDSLLSSVRWSYDRLSPFRLVRKNLIDVYTGGSYGEGGDSGSVPVNMLELAISIYQRHLASHTPQVICSAESSMLRPTARELEIAMNHVIDKRLDLGKVINEWVIDALFCIGILKIGEKDPLNPTPRGFMGKDIPIYVDAVGLEDWVHDVSARRYEDVDYAGHMYEAPLDEILDSGEFDEKAKDKLLESVKHAATRTTDMFGSVDDRPEFLSSPTSWVPDDFVQKVVLWELWLPRDNVIVTFGSTTDERPLRVMDWTGPEHGPYHLLGFSPVPGNIMPVSPAILWEDMMDLLNRLFLKIGDQADRCRRILAAPQKSRDDVETIIQTADGETAITANDPTQIKEFTLGGVDGGLMATFMQFKEMFSYIAGNIDSLGGLGPQSGTFGQDRMLSQSASGRLADMQERVIKATSRVCRDIGWYLWENPDIDLPLVKQITPNIKRDFNWNQFSKDGDFFDYNISIVPYSLRAKSPEERLNVLMSTVNQTILPAMQFMGEQGVEFDFLKYLETIARLTNVPELNELIRDATGKEMNDKPPVGSGREAMKSPVTQRNYTRQSVPGQQRAGGENTEAMQMFQQMEKSNSNMMPGPGRPSA